MTPAQACQRKIRYPSWSAGMAAILTKNLPIPPRLYRCHVCRQWHITKSDAFARRGA